MHDFTPLPKPPCGATAPDGQPCPAESAVVVASEWPASYATSSMAVWRCHDHVGAAVEAAVRHSADAVVTVTSLAWFDQAPEPAPEPPPVTSEPTLRLVR